ncbi:MAG: hypothetical protein ACP5N3_01805 [Candidatus Nanoarchaeia archaeon]
MVQTYLIPRERKAPERVLYKYFLAANGYSKFCPIKDFKERNPNLPEDFFESKYGAMFVKAKYLKENLEIHWHKIFNPSKYPAEIKQQRTFSNKKSKETNNVPQKKSTSAVISEAKKISIARIEEIINAAELAAAASEKNNIPYLPFRSLDEYSSEYRFCNNLIHRTSSLAQSPKIIAFFEKYAPKEKNQPAKK